jgi:site-specific DNA recombinase
MLKAIIYTRVSSKRQEEEGSGLQSQEAICREYTARKRLEVLKVFKDTFTGGDSRREGIANLIKFVKSNKFTKFVVVFDDISRFARDLKGHLEIREQLRKLNCLIVTPSKEFNDDADSLLVENLLASMAQHARMKNQEQVRSRMKGCLLNGYWPFKLPYGYCRKSIRGGAKEITPDEPHFSIARSALRGFANGSLESQAAVLRFLKSQPAFVDYHKDSNITIQRSYRLLTNILYSGYYIYPGYNIGLTKALHEPAISLESYHAIQHKIKGRYRKPINHSNSEFPAKGITVCADCCKPLTACWSTGKLKKYAYYLCYNRNCTCNRKSIPKREIEDGISDLLANLQPTPFAFCVFEKFVCEAKEATLAGSLSLKNQLTKSMQSNEKYLDLYIEQITKVKEEVVFRALEAKIRELSLQKEILADKLKNIDAPPAHLTKLFEHSYKFLSNPQNIWENGDLARRQAVVCACFVPPLRFKRSIGFRTPKLTPIFSALKASEEGDECLAEAQAAIHMLQRDAACFISIKISIKLAC